LLTYILPSEKQQGRTQNIQHKAIRNIIQAFYYQKENMGRRFPDEFGESVPNPAVSLVCCAVSILLPYGCCIKLANVIIFLQIKCSLEEWRSGDHENVPFTAETFASDNNKILKTISKVEADDYHGFSYRNAKKEWAISGMYVTDFIYFRIHIKVSYPARRASITLLKPYWIKQVDMRFVLERRITRLITIRNV
jgi:hypothetical protein